MQPPPAAVYVFSFAGGAWVLSQRIAPVIDQFTVAHGGYPGIELLRIAEPTQFDTYIAVKRGAPLSHYIEHFIDCLRSEMRAVGLTRTAPKKPSTRIRKN